VAEVGELAALGGPLGLLPMLPSICFLPYASICFHMLPLEGHSRGFAKEELHHRLGGTGLGLDSQSLMLSPCCAGAGLRISAPCQRCGQPYRTMKARHGLASRRLQ